VLYEVVRDNLETLYGSIAEGAIAVRVRKHARKELEDYLECGLLCYGFARLKCGECGERPLVASSCRGRGFCPSCLGRRMCGTAANLMERVLPQTGLRQWVLTFPFLLAPPPRAGRRGAGPALAPLRGNCADVLRLCCGEGGFWRREDGGGDGGAADLV
jgi:hypothetical protein